MEKDKVIPISTLFRRWYLTAKSHKYHKLIYVGLFVVVMVQVVVFSRSFGDIYVDNEDGRGSIGYGIARGGNGALGYKELHRKGGSPPRTDNPGILNELRDLDMNLYKRDKTILIVLGANAEGGVTGWKDPKDWSVERLSISNKKQYAKRHGYDLVIKDLTRKKKYSHEFREAWAKFDVVRAALKDYPKSEWIWYVDLNSYIMEPQHSLNKVVFDQMDKIHRDLNYFNPHNIPYELPYVEYGDQVDLILSQDCDGFNLNSFLVRKSDWTNLLFDTIYDPIFYKQMHIKWENEEEHALEYLYETQAWVRSRIGFVSNRQFNSLVRGSCENSVNRESFVYNETGRDFMVSLENCKKQNNCYEEMEFFKELSKKLHSNWITSWFV